MEEFSSSFGAETLEHVYQSEIYRYSTLVKLITPHKFCSTGNFGTPTLPMFIFTYVADNADQTNGTLMRLTVHVLPVNSIHKSPDTHEIC